MMRKRLMWQLFPSFVLVIVVAMGAAGWYSYYTFGRIYIEQTKSELTWLAYMVIQEADDADLWSRMNELDALCKRLGHTGDGRTRITVISPLGKVWGDSDEDIIHMDNHADRPEFMEAKERDFGSRLRGSDTLGIQMMYVAVPVRKQGQLVAVVRTSIPAIAIDQAVADILEKIIWSGIAITVCASLLSLGIARRISRPIISMQETAQEFARGNLNLRVPIPATAELKSLARALNQMARQLHERITTITNQRNELEVILASMIEGVLAVDDQARIVNVNLAAARLLNINPDISRGRHIEEMIRDVSLRQFVIDTLERRNPQETDITLPINGGRHFQVHGARLPDNQDQKLGAVIVLHDMTPIYRLENIRRDFVANVSHELRTPVTSIKGFVEALQESGFENKEQAGRYLNIVARHADRLNAIIDDLLSLSRLEQGTENRDLFFEETSLEQVAQTAVELSKVKAAEKSIQVEVINECPEPVKINTALFEQALFNLIDNAIKYSEPGSSVQVRLVQEDKECIIAVQDQGSGISPEHLPRIFERFYVVDKGRSRKMGGTGLGLAIVKHIAQVHGGSLSVESKLGKGSTFTIHLPRNN
jgi:two-component system phosphate regulon sensor histidine kinase PhoR